MEIINLIFGVASIVLIAGLIVYWLVAPMISVPFYPSSTTDIIKMFELAKLSRQDKVIDLGAGDGRLVLAASRICKSAVGVEHNPFLNLFAKFIEILSTNGPVEFKHKSFWEENLAEYDVVFAYLYPSVLKKLKAKFTAELTPKTRIVTHSFKIPGWKVQEELISEKDKYYLYVVGQQ